MAKKEAKEKPIEVTLWDAANKLRGSSLAIHPWSEMKCT